MTRQFQALVGRDKAGYCDVPHADRRSFEPSLSAQGAPPGEMRRVKSFLLGPPPSSRYSSLGPARLGARYTAAASFREHGSTLKRTSPDEPCHGLMVHGHDVHLVKGTRAIGTLSHSVADSVLDALVAKEMPAGL